MAKTNVYNIGVFMWFNNDIACYAENNYNINKLYCDKYGYTLIKSNERLYPERKPHWERFTLLLKYFDTFDYLMWIDADAHFFIDSPPISNIINEYPDKIFIISEDQYAKNPKYEINSGVFIIKSCDEGRDILNMWGYDNSLFKKMNNYNNWNDQGILQEMYRLNLLNIYENSLIIKYGVLQYFYDHDVLPVKLFGLDKKPFVFHLAGSNKEKRITHSNNYLNSYISSKYGKWINKNIQLSKKVIYDIILENENKNLKMLVFGLGYDSDLWYNITKQNTFFVEDNQHYIDLNKDINKNNIISYSYDGIKVRTTFTLTKQEINNFVIPQKLLDLAPFDIILIDGPKGYNEDCPGRFLPIYWSKTLLSHSNTIIYIDDATRNLEKKCINHFFTDNYKSFFNDRLGTMKIHI